MYSCSFESSAPVLSGAGLELWQGQTRIPRHRHARAYAALIVAGGYEESGSFGRYRVRAGEVLLHRAFDAHLDSFGSHGARILNLPLPARPRFGLGRVADADYIVRLARKDLSSASASLVEQLRPIDPAAADWPDILASDLINDPTLQLGEWSERHGLAQETLARGFRKVFGITPAAFRAEARAQRAWPCIADVAKPLAQIAEDSGFADQSHMTRAIVELTGSSPGRWRQVKSVQDEVRDGAVKRRT